MTVRATARMTGRQIINECKPRPVYYSNSYGSRQARPCLLCGTIIQGKFSDLEIHAKEKHNGNPTA